MHTVQVAKTLVIDAENNCLVLHRSSSHPHFPLAADLPGGEVDGDEAPTETMAREILEETGLQFSSKGIQLLFATTVTDRDTNIVRFLGVVHTLEIKPKVQISWEHNDAIWLPIGDLLTTLKHPEYTKGIRYILGHKLLDAESPESLKP